MKAFSLLFSIICIVLTFAGAGYVIYHGGQISAGYAVVPMVFSLIGVSLYRKQKS